MFRLLIYGFIVVFLRYYRVMYFTGYLQLPPLQYSGVIKCIKQHAGLAFLKVPTLYLSIFRLNKIYFAAAKTTFMQS